MGRRRKKRSREMSHRGGKYLEEVVCKVLGDHKVSEDRGTKDR